VLVVALGAGAIAVVQRQRADRQQRTAVAQRQIAVDQQAIADQQRAVAVAAQGKAQQSATAALDAERASKLRTLAGQSLAARSSQRDLAALLAVESWNGAKDDASKSALFGTFTFDPGFMGYLRFDGAAGVQGVAIPGTTTMLVSTFARNVDVVSPLSIVDVISGATVRRLDAIADRPVVFETVTVSPDGRFAAERAQVAYYGPSVAAVYDLSTGKVVGRPIPLPDVRDSMAVDSSGTRLAISSDAVGGVTVYDTTAGKVMASIPGLDGTTKAPDAFTSAGAIAYGPDGRLYLGSSGGHLRAFDPATFALVADITVPEFSTLGMMRFGEDGRTLIVRSVRFNSDTGAEIGSIMRIDLPTRTVVWRVSGTDYGNGACASFAFSVSADQLWCGDYFGRVRQRSVRTGARTGTVLQNQKGWATDLDLIGGPEGSTLAAVSNNDGVISRWRVDGGGPIQRLVARGKLIMGLSPDGTTLLVGTDNGGRPPLNLDYSLWDLTSDTAMPALPPMLFARVVGGSIVGVFSDDSKIGTWNLATKQRSDLPVRLPPIPTSASGSSDGSTFLLGYDDGHADEYDTATGALVLRMQLPLSDGGLQPKVGWLAMGNDRRRIYLVGEGLVEFDGTTGQIAAHNPDLAIGNVGVSPEGVVVATSVDGTIGIYDPTSLAKASSLPGARGYIQNLLFSADGTTLIGAGNDGSVSVYDLVTRTRIGDAIDVDRVNGSWTALRADGSVLAIETPHDDGVELWDLDPTRWLAAACVIAGRNLTHEEWATYIGDLASYAPTCPAFPVPADGSR